MCRATRNRRAASAVTFICGTLAAGRTESAVRDTYTDMGQGNADRRRRFDDLFVAFGPDVGACRLSPESVH